MEVFPFQNTAECKLFSGERTMRVSTLQAERLHSSLPPKENEKGHFSSITPTYSGKTATFRYAGAELTCLPASLSLDPELRAVWPAASRASGILMAGGC